VPAFLALLASAVWGTSDFGGGLLSRRWPPTAVVFLGMLGALGALLLGVPLAHPPAGPYLLYGAAAGISGGAALICFYRAMAAGPMSLVGPVTATGTVIPVLWAVARGESVGPVQGVGMALAFVGVLLASGPELRAAPAARSTFLFTLASAAGFGVYFIFMALGSATSVYGTLVSQRAAAVLLVAPLALRGIRTGRSTVNGLRISAGSLGLLALVAFGDASANGAYGLATRSRGARLAVVTVLASLYPVASTFWARGLLGERLRLIQNVGIVAALGGVLLLNV
jgi:drug/metabolite transporter (DMT)-like permease